MGGRNSVQKTVAEVATHGLRLFECDSGGFERLHMILRRNKKLYVGHKKKKTIITIERLYAVHYFILFLLRSSIDTESSVRLQCSA